MNVCSHIIKFENLHVLTGSTLTPEEIDSLKITPEYYIYLLDIIRKEYDIVIIDTNSSMFILQHTQSFRKHIDVTIF